MIMNKKIKYFLCVFSFVLICIVSSFICGYIDKNILEYKQHSIETITYKINRPTDVSRENIKNYIDSLIGYSNYTLFHTDLQSPLWGLAYIQENKIYIENSLNYENYCFVLTHEIVHIKYNVHNERKTNLITWKILFFSGNDYFKNIALQYAYKDLHGYIDYDYSILGYVEKYIMEDQCL